MTLDEQIDELMFLARERYPRERVADLVATLRREAMREAFEEMAAWCDARRQNVAVGNDDRWTLAVIAVHARDRARELGGETLAVCAKPFSCDDENCEGKHG